MTIKAQTVQNKSSATVALATVFMHKVSCGNTAHSLARKINSIHQQLCQSHSWQLHNDVYIVLHAAVYTCIKVKVIFLLMSIFIIIASVRRSNLI